MKKKKFVKKISMFKFFTNNSEKSTSEKSMLKLLVDIFIEQSNIIKQIKIIYSKNVILQRIIKTKRMSKRKIFVNITRTKLKLKLNDCEINNNLFYVKNRLYVFKNEIIYAIILKNIHEI